MYDGWTKFRTHFVAIYGVYMRKIPNRGIQNCWEDSKIAITFLSVSPMAKSEVETEADRDGMGTTLDGEATYFDAKTHAAHFVEVFKFYNVDIREWVVC